MRTRISQVLNSSRFLILINSNTTVIMTLTTTTIIVVHNNNTCCIFNLETFYKNTHLYKVSSREAREGQGDRARLVLARPPPHQTRPAKVGPHSRGSAPRVRERLSTMLRLFGLRASTESRRASSSRLLRPTRALIGRSVEIFPPTALPCMKAASDVMGSRWYR